MAPLFYGGHWVPEQVEWCASWEQVTALAPDVIVVMCCGYDLAENVAFARTLPE